MVEAFLGQARSKASRSHRSKACTCTMLGPDRPPGSDRMWVAKLGRKPSKFQNQMDVLHASLDGPAVSRTMLTNVICLFYRRRCWASPVLGICLTLIGGRPGHACCPVFRLHRACILGLFRWVEYKTILTRCPGSFDVRLHGNCEGPLWMLGSGTSVEAKPSRSPWVSFCSRSSPILRL